jgi:hypothetical protein
MYLAILIGLLGAVIGGLVARKRKGRGLDIAQYAGVYLIAFAILGLLLNVILLRML